jgi:hypothetical protein
MERIIFRAVGEEHTMKSLKAFAVIFVVALVAPVLVFSQAIPSDGTELPSLNEPSAFFAHDESFNPNMLTPLNNAEQVNQTLNTMNNSNDTILWVLGSALVVLLLVKIASGQN